MLKIIRQTRLFTRLQSKPKLYFNAFRMNLSSSHDHNDHHGPKVKIHAPSVTEKIVWINIENHGQFERIPAYEGESLLEALQRFKVENIPGTCLGGEDINKMTEKPIDPTTYGPFCAGCHVIIANPWRKRMGELHYLEARNLQQADYPIGPNSRLACCFAVEKWMNEMVITIGPQEYALEETN